MLLSPEGVEKAQELQNYLFYLAVVYFLAMMTWTLISMCMECTPNIIKGMVRKYVLSVLNLLEEEQKRGLREKT